MLGNHSTSSKKERLEQYLAAGNIHLTGDEIDTLDAAGSKFAAWQRWEKVKKAVTFATGLMGLWAVKTVIANK